MHIAALPNKCLSRRREDFRHKNVQTSSSPTFVFAVPLFCTCCISGPSFTNESARQDVSAKGIRQGPLCDIHLHTNNTETGIQIASVQALHIPFMYHQKVEFKHPFMCRLPK